jgi:hypothetical protein
MTGEEDHPDSKPTDIHPSTKLPRTAPQHRQPKTSTKRIRLAAADERRKNLHQSYRVNSAGESKNKAPMADERRENVFKLKRKGTCCMAMSKEELIC